MFTVLLSSLAPQYFLSLLSVISGGTVDFTCLENHEMQGAFLCMWGLSLSQALRGHRHITLCSSQTAHGQQPGSVHNK